MDIAWEAINELRERTLDIDLTSEPLYGFYMACKLAKNGFYLFRGLFIYFCDPAEPKIFTVWFLTFVDLC